jgi:hypothetical protein
MWFKAGQELTAEQLEQAQRRACWTDQDPVEILASVVGLPILELHAKLWGVEVADLAVPDPQFGRLVPEDLARRYRCVPLGRQGTNTLVLAMVDPRDIIAIDDISLITGFDVVPMAASAEMIQIAINHLFGVTDLVEVEETMKDISAQDFGCLDFEEEIVLDRLREFVGGPMERSQNLWGNTDEAEIVEAEVLFAGWLVLAEGSVTVEIPTPAQPAQFSVEVFAVGALDWAPAEARFVTEKQLAVHLELPPFVHPQDQVEGRLRIVSGQPPFRLGLTCDGKPLGLPEVAESREPITFACKPGKFRATVEEIASGRCETTEATVETSGRLSGVKRTVQWLRKGDRLSRGEDKGILALVLLDGVRGPAERLGAVTADYGHLCCEQTAAKILSACALWMSSTNGKRARWESTIRAGIEREKTMFLPGRGLAMYPGQAQPCEYWGRLAALYLCQLELMRGHSKDSDFDQVIEQGIEIGHQAAKAHGVNWPPTERSSANECYLEMRFGNTECTEIVARAQSGFPDDGWGRVGERVRACYRSAILLRARQDLPLAIKLVNEIFQELVTSGGFYSTVDSIAAMALLDEVQSFLPAMGQGKANLEGQPDSLEAIEVTDGDALVEVTRAFVEDWSELRSTTSLKVNFPERVKAGQSVTLSIGIPDGYQDGDLVWICLPKALAQLSGGGQVRRFSVDFEGKSHLSLELVAVAPTQPRGETLLLCLRNMFLEERVALAEPLRVHVEAASISTVAGLEIGESLCRVDLTRHALYGEPQTLEQMQTLSGEIHNLELIDLLDRILGKAIESRASLLMFDWADEGAARCRLRLASGMQEIMRYPSPLQVLIVGRLQMVSANPLGRCGPQEGTVRLLERDWPVTILPTNLGLMATLQLQRRDDAYGLPRATDAGAVAPGLGWIRALSQLQQALSEDRPPDLEAIIQAKPADPHPVVDELIATLQSVPIPRQRALELLARLAATSVRS